MLEIQPVPHAIRFTACTKNTENIDSGLDVGLGLDAQYRTSNPMRGRKKISPQLTL